MFKTGKAAGAVRIFLVIMGLVFYFLIVEVRETVFWFYTISLIQNFLVRMRSEEKLAKKEKVTIKIEKKEYCREEASKKSQ